MRVTIPANELAALLLGGAAAAALGRIDDFLDLRARWQLIGQVGLALFAVGAGIVIDYINDPFGPGIIRFGGPFAAGFTIFWIVGMINSINFIDGLDGLSSGIALIAAVTLGLISLSTQVGQPLVAILCFALAGSLLGFLRWNLHPATIFSGTSGVQFVGYTLAVLSILGTAKVAVALLVLGVPIIDTFWIIVRRLLAGPVAVQPGPPPHPPPAAGPGPLASPDGLRHLRHLPGPRGPGPGALGRRPAVRLPRRLPGLRASAVHPDARLPPSTRGARSGRLRARSGGPMKLR